MGWINAILQHKRRSFFPVFLTYFLDNFGIAIAFPLFMSFILKSSHLTTLFSEKTAMFGVLIAAFPLAQLFGAPLIGQFSDRFGRKRAFFVTILGMGVGYTMTAFCVMKGWFPGLFISRFFTGLFAGNLTLCLAAIADMSPDDESRAKNFGRIGAIGGLSFIAAIAAGGIFADPHVSSHFNPSVPFWITAFLSFVNLTCMILLFHETHPPSRNPGVNPLKGFRNLALGFKNKDLRVIYCVNFLFLFAWIASMEFFPTQLMLDFKFQILQVTLCLMVTGAIWSFTNFWINRLLAKRFFPGRTLLCCLLLVGLLLLFLLFSKGAVLFFCLFFLAVCCASLCWTNAVATISLNAPSSIQGSILGINQSINSVASMLSPMVGGLLMIMNKNALFLFAGGMTLLAFCLLMSSKGYEEHPKNRFPK
jgi:DHA1 family tetracycline resistance protein-like MFS transporter